MQANKIRGRLAEMGLTQYRLAEMLHISAATLSAKMNGLRPFDAEEIKSICRILSIDDPVEMAEIFLT